VDIPQFLKGSGFQISDGDGIRLEPADDKEQAFLDRLLSGQLSPEN